MVNALLRRAVFLDRDGVINRAYVRDGKPYPPASLEQLEILPEVRAALERLRKGGFLNVIVTNQPDVATGMQRREVVEAMHAWILKNLQIDAIKVCYHADVDRCACRKPMPGMLLEAGQELDIDLARSSLVGDRWRDIGASHAAGCEKSYFIDYGYAEKRPDKPYLAVKSLPEAVNLILESASRAA